MRLQTTKYFASALLAALLSLVAGKASAQQDQAGGNWPNIHWGNNNFASADFDIASWSKYLHNAVVDGAPNGLSAIISDSFSAPSYALFGSKTTIWSINGDGYIQRDASKANLGALAAGRIVYGDGVQFDCLTGGVGSPSAVCSGNKTLARKEFAHPQFTFTVLLVPITMDAKFYAQLGVSSNGYGQVNLPTTDGSVLDRTNGVIGISGNVTADSFVGVGIPIIFNAGARVVVDFIKGGMTSSAVASRSACPSGASKCGAHAASYYIQGALTLGDSQNPLSTLGGKVDAKMTVLGVSVSKNLFNWKGTVYKGTSAFYDNRVPAPFPSSY